MSFIRDHVVSGFNLDDADLSASVETRGVKIDMQVQLP